jgi:hypothetical protein
MNDLDSRCFEAAQDVLLSVAFARLASSRNQVSINHLVVEVIKVEFFCLSSLQVDLATGSLWTSTFEKNAAESSHFNSIREKICMI